VNSGSGFRSGSKGSGLVEGGSGSAGTFDGSSIGSMKMVRRGSPMFMLEALLHRGVAVRAVILPRQLDGVLTWFMDSYRCFRPVRLSTSSLSLHGHRRNEAAPGARAARRSAGTALSGGIDCEEDRTLRAVLLGMLREPREQG
jgi:hypothetical protein